MTTQISPSHSPDMVSFAGRAIRLLAFLTLLPSLALSASSSPLLALAPTVDCVKGVLHTGTPQGKNVTIAGVNTYVAEPPKGHDKDPKKVIFFFSDVYSAVWINNMLIQDYFATQGA